MSKEGEVVFNDRKMEEERLVLYSCHIRRKEDSFFYGAEVGGRGTKGEDGLLTTIP